MSPVRLFAAKAMGCGLRRMLGEHLLLDGGEIIKKCAKLFGLDTLPTSRELRIALHYANWLET